LSTTTANGALKQRLPLLAILLVFIVLKFPHLSYPFIWDESWPYASAINQMYERGPSLLPGVIDSELSRGHPLLLHFIVSSWMRVFGPSHMAMHSVMLLIACLLLISVYEAAKRIGGVKAAVITTVLIGFQQIFFVQASFVMPEVLLAMLAFLTIYFYIQRRYILTTLFMTLLCFTKESGMVVGIVLGIDALISLFQKQISVKEKIYKLGSLVLPAVAVGAFFIIQKQRCGWYMFPLHTEAISFSKDEFSTKFRDCMKVFFRDDMRKVWFAGVGMLSLIVAIKNKYRRYAVMLVLLVTCILIATIDFAPPMRGVFLAGLAVLLPAVINQWSREVGIADKNLRKFLLLSACLVVAFSIFTATNFFITRYLIIALIPLLFIGGLIYADSLLKLNKYLFWPGLLLIVVLQALSYYRANHIADVKITAYDAMDVQQDEVKFAEDANYYDKWTTVFENLQKLHLEDPGSGFRSNNRPFNKLLWGVMDSTQVVILDNVESMRAVDSSKQYRQDPHYKLVHRYQKGMVWNEVYERSR